MRLGLPRSLAGQTIGLLILALLGSHLLGLVIYNHDRGKIVAFTEAHDLADRTVGLVHMMQRLPSLRRDDVARASDGRSLHVALGDAPDIQDMGLDVELSGEVASYLLRQFVGWDADRVKVGLSDTPFFAKEKIHGNQTIIDPDTILDVRSAGGEYNYLHIAMRLDDGQWLNVVGALQRGTVFRMVPAAGYLISLVIGVTLIAAWMILRVTSPLTRFTAAAERLGKDIDSEPLQLSGPKEVHDAGEAFNTMQERLRRLMQNRTQMLAAISHDLRTPVTLLRLRAEAIQDRRESEKLLNTLDEMEEMIASVLEFTRATLLDEPLRQVDLSALLSSICDDLGDAGATVTCEVPGRTPYSC
ncbi:MAG: histidine kinase dimerization/phospho-acceptor domain-containing protein, partial [Lautropia sp.]